MKLLERDWSTFIGRLPAWRSLSNTARRAFLALKSNESRSTGEFGDDFPRLVELRLLLGLPDAKRAHLHPDAANFWRAMRAFSRHPVLREPTEERLRQYLLEHFNHAERTALSGPDASGWHDRDERLVQCLRDAERLEEFLGAADARAFERKRLKTDAHFMEKPDAPSLTTADAVNSAKALVTLAMKSSQPIAFDELPSRLSEFSSTARELGLHACMRLALVLADLDEQENPRLWIWPPLARRLQRLPPVRARVAEPLKTYCGTPRLDDITSVIVALASEPARIKSDGHSVFARDSERLRGALVDLEDWIALVPGARFTERSYRLDSALNDALARGWIERAQVSTTSTAIQVAAAGRSWLGRPLDERMRQLLEPVKFSAPSHDGTRRRAQDPLLEMEEALAHFDRLDTAPTSRGSHKKSALLAAWKELDGAAYVNFEEWVEHATRSHSPSESNAGRASRSTPWAYYSTSAEDREAAWRRAIVWSLGDWLWPFGGIDLGRTSAAQLCLRLNSRGRYLIGTAHELEVERVAEARVAIVVQPNFEVVFLGPSAVGEAALAPFCRRRGRGVGTLFEITRESCIAAASTGMTGAQALATLEGTATRALPQNVEHEVRAWFDSASRVSLAAVELLRCPDSGTATRILGVTKGKVRAISDTVLEIVDASDRAGLLRALRKHGIFVDLPDAPGNRGGWRRSARRWGRDDPD